MCSIHQIHHTFIFAGVGCGISDLVSRLSSPPYKWESKWDSDNLDDEAFILTVSSQLSHHRDRHVLEGKLA